MANEIIAALQASELFRDLPQKQLKRICDAGKVMSFQAGAEVVAEGEGAGRFFLILDGTAGVFVHGVHRGNWVRVTPWARSLCSTGEPERRR